jgi:hypothetical protein
MYRELTNDQAKQVIDTEQVFQAMKDAERAAAGCRGGMHWKTIGDKQYLYRSHDRTGKANSQGPRSPETELIYEKFTKHKAEVTDLLAKLRDQMSVQARINAALRVGSVPNPVADICIELEKADLLGNSVMVIGTNSMHVYEAMAGVRFPSDIMSTVDIDLLWNHKSKLSLAAKEEIEMAGLMGILKRADKSFAVSESMPYRAIAGSKYMVDLIRQMPNPPWAKEADRFFDEDDLIATDIWNMKWMLGAPRVTHPVIAVNGRVFNMTAPDPRAFAMFKLWLSNAEDREPEKKNRDLAQAQAVIALIEDRLPHLASKWRALRSFPADVVEETMVEVERMRG